MDFEKKEWLPYSGWPFDKSHLDPFYGRAQMVCGLGPYCYDAREWGGAQAPGLPFEESVIGTDVWQFGPQTAFTQRYREELEGDQAVMVYLHANALELETNEAATAVTGLRAGCLNGRAFRVSAKVFILASGGVENPRLLLLSNRTQRSGLGNQHGLVGRFFMEHQLVRCGTLTPASRELFNRAGLYDARPVEGVKVMGKLQFSAEVLRREKLLNVSAALYPKHGRYRRFRQDSVDSLAALLSAGRRLRVPDDAAGHVRRVLSGADYVFAAACRKATRGRLFPFYAETTGLLDGGGWSALRPQGEEVLGLRSPHARGAGPRPGEPRHARG